MRSLRNWSIQRADDVAWPGRRRAGRDAKWCVVGNLSRHKIGNKLHGSAYNRGTDAYFIMGFTKDDGLIKVWYAGRGYKGD